jgi:hypothetical protein
MLCIETRACFYLVVIIISMRLKDITEYFSYLRIYLMFLFAYSAKSCIFVEKMREYLFNRKTNN